jgi:glycosyltransferase involved in cell wall biosynthesis
VVANSVFLSNYGRKYNPRSFCIGQGYEQGNFNPSMSFLKPRDMEKITGKVVGYVGTLTSMRLDVQLMLDVANEMLDLQFVLVGPEDKFFQESVLHECENVHFLGLKKMKELAAYVKHFDVCFNPQLVNDLTIGNYPLKIDEYLSMGKPTVATRTEAMESFADHTYLAVGKQEYVAQIRKALKEDSKDRQLARMGFAADHTWSNSIGQLYEHLKKAD